jgi:hypothetical protein
MSSVVISGDTSGAITLSAPAVAGTNTITLPAATGTVMVSGNMPAFSAYLSSNQSISSATWTKLTFDTEEFDTNNNFASSTFTPTVAGYYQITACFGSSGGGGIGLKIYKNGSAYKLGTWLSLPSGSWSAGSSFPIAGLVYCNGSTDYIEIYGYNSTGSPIVQSGSDVTYFQATMTRSA